MDRRHVFRAAADDRRAMRNHKCARRRDKATSRLAAKAPMAVSMSTSLPTGAMIGTTLSDRAAFSNSNDESSFFNGGKG
jgi:hypothetical protein